MGVILKIGEISFMDGSVVKFCNIEDLLDDDELEMEILLWLFGFDLENFDELVKKKV